MITLISMIHNRAGVNGKRLEAIIKERFSMVEHEVCASTGSLYKRLCQPNCAGKHEIFLLLADTPERLEKMMAMKPLVEGRRLVLILPGNQKKLLSMGHRLLPRYVCCQKDNHEEVVSVLEKMIDVLNSGAGKELDAGMAVTPEERRPCGDRSIGKGDDNVFAGKI